MMNYDTPHILGVLISVLAWTYVIYLVLRYAKCFWNQHDDVVINVNDKVDDYVETMTACLKCHRKTLVRYSLSSKTRIGIYGYKNPVEVANMIDKIYKNRPHNG